MALERHTNIVNAPGKKSNFGNKKIVPSKYTLKNQLGNIVHNNVGKSEIDAIFENIEKLKVSKRGWLYNIDNALFIINYYKVHFLI